MWRWPSCPPRDSQLLCAHILLALALATPTASASGTLAAKVRGTVANATAEDEARQAAVPLLKATHAAESRRRTSGQSGSCAATTADVPSDSLQLQLYSRFFDADCLSDPYVGWCYHLAYECPLDWLPAGSVRDTPPPLDETHTPHWTEPHRLAKRPLARTLSISYISLSPHRPPSVPPDRTPACSTARTAPTIPSRRAAARGRPHSTAPRRAAFRRPRRVSPTPGVPTAPCTT